METEKDDLVVNERSDRSYTDRLTAIREREILDGKYGYQKYTEETVVNAWLVNVQPSEAYDSYTKTIQAATDFYFLAQDGKRLKITYPFRPYLYLGTTPGFEFQVAAFLTKRYPTIKVEHVEKENLDLKNHLAGLKSKFLFISFISTVEMAAFKKDIFFQIKKNQKNQKTATDYTSMLATHFGVEKQLINSDAIEQILDIREYDLPYHMRVCIDEKIFVGLWYEICGCDPEIQKPRITRNKDLIVAPDPVVCAFDIETTKLPLKFPDAEFDQVMMISYMIDGVGYLIINREIVAADVQDFEYTPKPEFKGDFTVFNEENEKALLNRFFDHMLKVKPHIMVTYNGDFFDWPFVDTRAKFHGIDMQKEIGFCKDNMDEYKHINCIHMDAYRWVKRDSYLPVGSQNLKATTRAKLRYDPIELDPELMVKMAREQPQVLASYSVSDAVATYYLYMKYVHPFTFALCTIIPLGPDDVLRKGSGTLCEALLMVEAFHKSIIYPNKQIQASHKMTNDGHLLESETYVGGHVEALESGVFRANIPCKFRMEIETLEQLKAEVKQTLEYSLIHEMEIDLDTLDNLDEVVADIQQRIDGLIADPVRTENPKIYHLDVGAMYPNIILTNRLQPPAVVTEEDCLACVYNTSDAMCKRDMTWVWRGEIVPAKRGEYTRLMQQLEQEKFGRPPRPFHMLPREEKLAIEKKRVQDFCKRSYGRVHLTRTEERTSTVCERENGFYINTVRAFRDRRYDYKAMLKKAKNDLAVIPDDDPNEQKIGQAKVVLFDSLQLAHKCILNSFYGYVMRKGSRWFSMEMAGIVCHTGSNIITEARQLVEKIGRPLELDTDGIWCLLPDSFPENCTIKSKTGKPVTLSYPGAMLNALVKDKFTNDQYHVLKEDGSYEITSENSIFFEVDGPYLAMVLPASKEEGKKLKKRYAVFNFDGSLAELKGFEIKRRGELNIIKEFQKDVFKAFLGGATLQEAYQSAAQFADKWLDVLFTKGANVTDEELFDLISENKSMSRKLEDYGTQKSTSITTAKRLAAFLGPDMVKNAGLACNYVISHLPPFTPVTDRAIPVAIFQADPKVTVTYLKKWTGNDKINVDNINIRELLDWSYYIERFGSCVQKIVTIPASLQGINNPVPRVPHPDWLENVKRKKLEMACQPKITDIFKKKSDMPGTPLTPRTPRITPLRKRPRPAVFMEDLVGNDNDVAEVDAAGNLVKRQRTEDDAETIPVTPSRLTGWLQKKRIATQDTTPTRTQRITQKNPVEDEVQKKTWKNDGFLPWLAFMKKKWKTMRDDRKKFLRANKGSLAGYQSSVGGISNLDSMLAMSRDKLNKEQWHVLQMSETTIPGVFDCFAYVCGTVKRFSINIPRIFYVNYLEKPENCSGKLVEKLLPKMQKSYFLYEYEADESKFKAEMKKFNSLLCTGHIAGIYETEMPLLFRSFLQIGAACKLRYSSNAATYNLRHFERVPLPEAKEIEIEEFNVIYFYEFSQVNRTVFMLVAPHKKQGYYFIINKSRIDVHNLNHLYMEQFARFSTMDLRLPADAEDIDFETIQLTSLKEANKQVTNLMKTIRPNPTELTLLSLQTNRQTSELLDIFPSLKEMPNIRVGAREPQNIMNTLDWGNIMSKRIMQHFLNSQVYLDDAWAISHYLSIPVGNIPQDVMSLALDLFYGRTLQSHNYILWASTSGRPDFGGKEMEDYRLAVEWDNVAFKRHHGRVINESGFERINCVADLEIGAVAVNALMQNVRIVEAEGASQFIGYTNTAQDLTIDNAVSKNGIRPTTSITDFDEGAAVSGALRVLRQVFHELIKDIHVNENVFADQLVMHMYRWMSDPNSLLYNPAVCSTINILMRKLCLLLSTEVQRLGGSVIYCSFSRLVVSTGKQNNTQAKMFVSSLCDTLSNNSLFAALQMTPIHLWNVCLWTDPSNYCAVGFHKDEETENIDERVDVHFSMVEELPKKCHDAFKQIITGYVMLVARESKDGKDDSALLEFSKDLLSNELGPRLFQITEKLTKLRHILNKEYKENHLPDADEIDENFDVPLQFVKAICQVLSAEKELVDSVENLRNQLIYLLRTNGNVLEDWQAPSAVCVLDALFCTKCNQCVNLDLSAPVEDGEFHCQFCKAVISSEMVDNLLVKRLDKIVTAFIIQDFKCTKCRQLAAKYLQRHCDCSHAYERVIALTDFVHNLKVVNRISKLHGLTYSEFASKKKIACYEA